MFDFNKLDDYKATLDDGLIIEDDGEIYIRMRFINGKYRVIFEDFYPVVSGTGLCRIEESDWEIFKKKVTDYFLGVGTDEN